jgi:hypothetical protein
MTDNGGVSGIARLMSAKSCAWIFDVTTKAWYEWVRYDPTAPAPIVTAPHYTRWDENDVAAYRALQIAEQRSGHVKKKPEAVTAGAGEKSRRGGKKGRRDEDGNSERQSAAAETANGWRGSDGL